MKKNRKFKKNTLKIIGGKFKKYQIKIHKILDQQKILFEKHYLIGYKIISQIQNV